MTLKHTISLRKLGNFDFQSCYRTVIVHPEWNLIFFVGVVVESTVITYNMDNRVVVRLAPHCKVLACSTKIDKDTKATKKQTETKRFELHHAQHSSIHLIQSTTPRPRSNETFAWSDGAAWPCHVNASIPTATGY
jgi:hypothetical protein